MKKKPSDWIESFPLHDGPSVCALDKTLPDIGIEKQAYHGGLFIGNHIHKCCQVTLSISIYKICYSTINYTKQGDNIEKLCTSIVTAVPQVLTVTRATAENIAQAFTVTPKLHMSEDHVMPWVRRWKFGLGFYGEQGAESIHARFNSMQRTYANVRNATERLKAIVKEHNMSVLP